MKRLGLPLILAGVMLHSPLTSQAADSQNQPKQQQPPYGMGPYGGHMRGYGMPMWGGGG
ncbi:MAG: hypothetical protein HGB16_00680, partial [Chlorobaculum sp.]|nr:hypothetical protein [Chlorobaculum sp.]